MRCSYVPQVLWVVTLTSRYWKCLSLESVLIQPEFNTKNPQSIFYSLGRDTHSKQEATNCSVHLILTFICGRWGVLILNRMVAIINTLVWLFSDQLQLLFADWMIICTPCLVWTPCWARNRLFANCMLMPVLRSLIALKLFATLHLVIITVSSRV